MNLDVLIADPIFRFIAAPILFVSIMAFPWAFGYVFVEVIWWAKGKGKDDIHY